MLQGNVQSVDIALELFNLLSSSDTKLRQPVGLETQLLQDDRMDSDVSKSMLQLLQVSHFDVKCLSANHKYADYSFFTQHISAMSQSTAAPVSRLSQSNAVAQSLGSVPQVACVYSVIWL